MFCFDSVQMIHKLNFIFFKLWQVLLTGLKGNDADASIAPLYLNAVLELLAFGKLSKDIVASGLLEKHIKSAIEKPFVHRETGLLSIAAMMRIGALDSDAQSKYIKNWSSLLQDSQVKNKYIYKLIWKMNMKFIIIVIIIFVFK